MKVKERLRKCTRWKKTEATLQLNTMHDSELELFDIKNIFEIIGKIWALIRM